MPKGAYSIARIDGLKISSRRAIVFLVRNGEMNGKSVFDRLPKDRDREVRNRFDHWIDGNDAPAHYFHGWNNPNTTGASVSSGKKSESTSVFMDLSATRNGTTHDFNFALWYSILPKPLRILISAFSMK